MKNKIAKILGVVLTAATVASLFLFAAPVSAAVTPQTWTDYGVPTATGYVLPENSGTPSNIVISGPIEKGFDDALYCQVTTTASANPILLKSTDFGRTWKKLSAASALLTATNYITAIAASPTEANVVYIAVTDTVATASTVYKSVDGGTSWVSEVNMPVANGTISCMEVAKLAANYVVVAGTTGVVGASVYYMDESAVFFSFQQVGTNSFNTAFIAAYGGGGVNSILAVALSPSFATDRAVIAIGTDGAQTGVLVDIFGGAWGGTIGNPAVIAAVATNAAIAFPSDWNVITSANFFFGIRTGAATGGVYRFIGVSAPAASIINLLSSGAEPIVSLQVSGTILSSTILAGGSDNKIYRSTNAGASFGGGAGPSEQPTGTAPHNVYVIMKSDFATSNIAVALVAVTAGVADDQTGLNLSKDGGNLWAQVSLLNDDIASIQDVAITSNSTVFLSVYGNGTNTSLWRNDGNWERVYYKSTQLFNMVRVSPAYATDKVVFLALFASTNALQYSTDNGHTFKSQIVQPGATVGPAQGVASLYVKDAQTQFVGTGAPWTTSSICKTANNGFIWSVVTVTGLAANVIDIKAAPNGDLFAAATSGAGAVNVAKSTDSGATWATLKVPGSTTTVATLPVVAGFVYVAPAADYATSGNIFLTTSAGGLYRYPGTDATLAYYVNGWYRVDNATPYPTYAVAGASGIVTAPGGPGSSVEGSGMVYATDSSAGVGVVARERGLLTNGVERIPGAAASGVVSPFVGLWASSGATAGNVQLWTIGNNGTNVTLFTYIDTLGIPGTGVAISNLVTTQTPFFWPLYTSQCTVTWNALPNATDYGVFVNVIQQKNLFTAATAGAAVAYTAGAVTANITGMTPGTTYYVSVWAISPVSSFLFGGSTTINTPLAPPTTPMDLVPKAGAINVPVLPAFQWAAVTGATGYTLQLDTKPTFDSTSGGPMFTTNLTGTAYIWTGTALANNTDYYWRVRATLSGGTSSDWVVSVFTTIPATTPPVTVVPPPTPTLIVTQPPQVTITIPPQPTPTYTFTQPTYTIAQPVTTTPSYIWAIVGVGAVLTLAVIILIIRTRRVV